MKTLHGSEESQVTLSVLLEFLHTWIFILQQTTEHSEKSEIQLTKVSQNQACTKISHIMLTQDNDQRWKQP